MGELTKVFTAEKESWAEGNKRRADQILVYERQLREAEARYARLRGGYSKLVQLL